MVKQQNTCTQRKAHNMSNAKLWRKRKYLKISYGFDQNHTTRIDLKRIKLLAFQKRTSFLCKLDLHSFARCCGNNTRICFYLMAFGSTNNLKHTLISHILTSNKRVYFSTGNGFFLSTKIRVFIELALENMIAWKISHVEDCGIMVYNYATYSTTQMDLDLQSIS